MYRATISLLTMICLALGVTSIRNTSFALDSSSNIASMETISCERKRLLLSHRGDSGLSPILFPKHARFQISQFEIEDGVVKISLSEKVSEQAIEKYRGRYLEHLKRNLKNFSLVYRKDGRFHGVVDLKSKYDLASTTVAYQCDATTEQIEASILLFQSQKTASNSEPTSEGRIKALEAELATLKSQLPPNQNRLTDNQVPLIIITHSGTEQRKGIIKGYVPDNVQLANVIVDGESVNITADGLFEWTGFVPATGKDILVEAIDTAALSFKQVIHLTRGQIEQAIGPMFDDLNPMAGKRVSQNKNALALIVGISDYKRTDAPAIYADKDAQYFHDYASLKLGIPDQNITTLVNDKAEQGDVLLAVKDWLRRSSKAGKSDVYIFFAGHGLASQDGEQMFLLPYDGRPRLLENTAIPRDELFSDIAAANPRSVTVFLDTCYSGTTRGPDMLIASRPIAIRAKEQAVPQGFTVMTAAAGDQTAKPLEEAKHGMFSYFLMKGMEGDADVNQDNQITAGELHAYVQQNVIQQSSGTQTPELQGDAERVLVRFQ